MIFCHRGSRFSPPDNLRRGAVIKDLHGEEWAYSGESKDGSRDGATFVRPRKETLVPATVAGCAQVAPVEAVATRYKGTPCNLREYFYANNLKVCRYEYGEKDKTFRPSFFLNGGWHEGNGDLIWPHYGSYAQGSVIEVEGEKCVDILRSIGIAAVTHPGHQRDSTSCASRYKAAFDAGVKSIYYIADNDKAGEDKAKACQASAREVGIDLRIIQAVSIYPDIPIGGSVDDMPVDQLATLIPAAVATAANRRLSLDRASADGIRRELELFAMEGSELHADIAAAIADIAAANDVSTYDAQRIWDSIQRDQTLAVEAKSSVDAILRRQDLFERRNAINANDFMPAQICDAARLLTQNMACDDLTAMSMILAGIAGCVKAGHRIDAGDGVFVKAPVLWVILVGSSGSGKSPIMKVLVKDRYGLVVRMYKERSEEIHEQWYVLHGERKSKDAPPPPQPLQTLVTNFTTEALNRILVDNHRQCLSTMLYSEEVKEILGNFDEYKPTGKGRGKETFLSLFDGDVSAEYRLGRNSYAATGKVQNALVGGAQPGVFRGMIGQGDEAGLFARCLVIPVSEEYVKPNFRRTPEEILNVLNAGKVIEDFYIRCASVDPLAVRLSPQAIDLFEELSKDTYDKRNSVALESQKAVYGKRMGYVLSVALVLHIAAVATGLEQQTGTLVSAGTLAKAVTLVDLLQAYAVLEQQDAQISESGSFDLSRRIHRFAQANGPTPARKFAADCVPARLRKQITTAKIKAAMRAMETMGIGRLVKIGTTESFEAIGRYPD